MKEIIKSKDKSIESVRSSMCLSNLFEVEEKWQEILREGDFSKGRDGLKFTKGNLEKIVENFKNNTIQSGMLSSEGYSELPVNIDHLMGAAERDAAGWIYDLKVEKNGRKGCSLFAKIRWTEFGKDKIEKELFRGFSVEIHTKDMPFLNVETGEKVPFVLTGLALTNEPFIPNMKPAELSKSKIKNFYINKMETIKLMLSSLAGKEKISRAELELLNTVVDTLEDDEKIEVKEEVEAVEAKVEATEAEEAEEAKVKAEEAEKAAKAKEDAEKLSKVKMAKDEQIEKLSKELSSVHSELDKVKMERRSEKTRLSVTKLFEEGKIVGEKIIDKTSEMLLSKSEKDAEEMLSFLSAQPARVDFKEKGHAQAVAKEELSATDILAKAKKLKADGDTRELSEIIESFKI